MRFFRNFSQSKKFDLKFSNAKSLNQNNIINSSLWMGGRAA
jgi:hypothetical protein